MFRRLLRDWLSLTRGERRGLQVLSFLIILLILFRFFMPRFVKPSEPLLSRDEILKLENQLALASVSEKAKQEDLNPPEVFLFDPNIADYEELVRLGLSQRTARTLINYREAGASFYSDSDLLKVYGLGPDLFARLQPAIRINTFEKDNQNEDNFFGFRDIESLSLETFSDSQTAASSYENYSAASPFELNSADSLQLLSVYGIGPAFAHRIIAYRELLGGFYSQEQLMEVYGFSQQQYRELFIRCFIDSTRLRRLRLNHMDADSFALHPYLDRYQADALVTFRQIMGSYSGTYQVIENKLLQDSVFDKIFPYLDVSTE